MVLTVGGGGGGGGGVKIEPSKPHEKVTEYDQETP